MKNFKAKRVIKNGGKKGKNFIMKIMNILILMM